MNRINKYYNYQIGGKPFDKYQFDTEAEFASWYDSKNKPSLQLLRDQLSKFQIGSLTPLNDGPFNILVGCTNSDDNDYFRFKDSEFYSLFIDSRLDVQFEGKKQYYMYTINYEQLIAQKKYIPQNILFFVEVVDK